MRGSTRSGTSGKRRFDEVVSLLVEANEAGLDFDELQQLGVYESQCNAWCLKADRVVKNCSWLNLICSSLGDDDDGDGDDGGLSDSEEEETGGESNGANASTNISENSHDDGPTIIDVKDVFKSSWWITDDIQACAS